MSAVLLGWANKSHIAKKICRILVSCIYLYIQVFRYNLGKYTPHFRTVLISIFVLSLLSSEEERILFFLGGGVGLVP
jgi:hypothetical protein